MNFWKKNRTEMFGRNVPINKIVVTDYKCGDERSFKNRYLHGWPVRHYITGPVEAFVFTFRDKAITYEFILDKYELLRLCDIIDESRFEEEIKK